MNLAFLESIKKRFSTGIVKMVLKVVAGAPPSGEKCGIAQS